ncbi:MAG: RecQ family ATP-dependent DNA helicase [Spirochaetaceae bacterium]|jgi:ATP-dependent DNA helicase RecQ|nr:RecQ family ATP-dependent DNA helicase [Spirochaetaceae bacterium]
MEFYELENEFEDPVQKAAKELFGMSYLFPYQRLVIGNIIEAAKKIDNNSVNSEDDTVVEDEDRFASGRQIVILPTGAGKSLCFQLPAMMLDGPTLVIYPILSLMSDQERRLAEKNFAPVTLRGGQSAEERNIIWKKLSSGESRFIISNPEVLLTPKVLETLPRLGIAHIVIDEAHCVSEWGESFRPSYLEIEKIIKASGAPIVTAFTATASALVLEKIEKYIFGGEGAHRIIGNPNRSNISYSARGCILRDIAIRDILSVNKKPAIVFCSSRPGTEKLARYLRNCLETNEVRFYHAGLEREEKNNVEKWFFSSDTGTLIATCAYGMGVDKPNIRTVIHRDCPPSVEAYLQESGRAGRDGEFSRAFLLWGPDDERALQRASTEADKQRLRSLFAFARDTKNCRRETLLKLLNYEGESSKPETECCDVCAGNANALLREEQPLTEFFRKNQRSWTADEAGEVLARSKLINWSNSDARNAIQSLIKMGKLYEHRYFPWKSKISVLRMKKRI